MAVTIADGGLIATGRVALDGTAANCTQITVNARYQRVTLTFKQSDGTTADAGKVASAGTDGAAIGNDHFPVPADNALAVSLGGRASSQKAVAVDVFVAADTNSAFCHYLCESS